MIPHLMEPWLWATVMMLLLRYSAISGKFVGTKIFSDHDPFVPNTKKNYASAKKWVPTPHSVTLF